MIYLCNKTCFSIFLSQARNFLEPTELFKNEPEETIGKVTIALKITKAFRACYEEHRLKLASYFKDMDKPVLEWEFAPVLVFHRYDKFLARVETVVVRIMNKI